MLKSQHPRDRELLMALDGELPQRRQAVVDEHVSACLACRSRFHRSEQRLRKPVVFTNRRSGRLRHHSVPRAFDWNMRFGTLRTTESVLAGSFPQYAGAAADTSQPGYGGRRRGACGRLDVTRSDLVRAPGPESEAPLPIATLTPGAVSSLTAMELCAGERPSRLVTVESREQVLRDYGMEKVSTRTYELDALITPELGGTTAPENLWPQRYASPVWNARVKDELEQLLPRLVCAHHVELAQAQREIASDWVAAYRRYFKTDVPLQAHAGAPLDAKTIWSLPLFAYVAENSAPMVLNVRFVRP